MQAAPPELTRGSIPHPGLTGTRVTFFADRERALRHLRDHVLTAPECEAWLLVAPALAGHLDFTNPDGRAAFFRQAHDTRGVSAQAVFDLYRAASARAATEAFLLAWHATDGPVTVVLGTTGVLVLIDGPSVTTVYLPGQGEPSAVRAGQSAPADSLGRERGRMRRADHHPPREQRRREQLAARQSPDERLYYCVFRPVVQFLRTRYHRSWTLDGQRRCDDALLKDVLPPMSQLRLEDWRAYRDQVDAGASHEQ